MASRVPSRVHIASGMTDMIALLTSSGQGADMSEFCGGGARSTTIAIRRNLSTGINFDLVAHIDLGVPATQRWTLQYLDQHEVQVLVMAPSCRALGPPSNLNYHIHHETWLKSYEEDAPHVRFCGTAAQKQLKQGRHFIVENPWPTWLFHEPPWPAVCQNQQVCSVIVDQCMMGLKNRDGLHVKKPTILVASHPALLEPFKGMRCNGKHVHSQAFWPRTCKIAAVALEFRRAHR